MTTNKKSLIGVHPSLHTALETIAAREKTDVTDIVERALMEFAWNENALDEKDYMEMKMARELIDQVVRTALEILSKEGSRTDITYAAIKVCKEDQSWIEKYRTVVGDDIYRNGNPRKGPINRQFGFRVRLATGARPQLGPNGKPVNEKVVGDIIQSYTPLIHD